MFGSPADTRELTAPVYTVEKGGALFRALPSLLAVACLVLAGYAGIQVIKDQFAPAGRVAQLEMEKAELAHRLSAQSNRLDEEVTKARLQAEMDEATRAELERQLEELTLKVKELSEELSFYKQAQKTKK
ncbi:MAG: hypothetical protein KDH20_21745 [Rhodocyclaceae bacterium]|nr:hypothetical protein [Rhodocyclaceae bacterium]